MTVQRDIVRRDEAEAGYDLRLFVSGASKLSARAIDNVRLLCDRHLDARSRLTVVDVHDDPADALRCHVHVVPTLVRTQPLPVCRIVGDLSQTEHVLSMLLVEDVDTSRRPDR